MARPPSFINLLHIDCEGGEDISPQGLWKFFPKEEENLEDMCEGSSGKTPNLPKILIMLALDMRVFYQNVLGCNRDDQFSH